MSNCTDCEEYNQDKHYCPKFCDFIRDTTKEMQEFYKGEHEKLEKIEQIVNEWYDLSFVKTAELIKEVLEMETYPPLNLIEIPKGATNGDIIKAMFPNAKIVRGLYGISGTRLMCLNLGTRHDVHEMSFVEDWWKAPYTEKRGNENGSN